MKPIYKILLSLLLITLIIAAIFMFSEQSGADSHSLSRTFSTMIAKTWADTFGTNQSHYSIETLGDMLDNPVRKLAHICIYAVLGFANCIIAHIFVGKKLRFWHIGVCILVVSVVATFDELNQFYSNGRGASISDIILDTIGGCIGIYSVFILRDFFRHLKNGIQREQLTSKSINK